MNKRQIKKKNNKKISPVSSIKHDVISEVKRALNTLQFRHLKKSNVSVRVGWASHSHSTPILLGYNLKHDVTHIEITDTFELIHTESNTTFRFIVHTKDIPIAVVIALRKLDAIVDNDGKAENHLEFFVSG